jgi:hypothetical protein
MTRRSRSFESRAMRSAGESRWQGGPRGTGYGEPQWRLNLVGTSCTCPESALRAPPRPANVVRLAGAVFSRAASRRRSASRE